MLPGRFEDAWLYMGKLVALTQQMSLRFYDLDEMATMIEARNPSLSPMAWLLLGNNDQIRTKLLRMLVRGRPLAEGFREIFARITDNVLNLPERHLDYAEIGLSLNANVVLDLTIYNRRIYLATDLGLYQVDVTWREGGPAKLVGVTKRLDARCSSVSARFGAVVVSCGSQGLYGAFDAARNGGANHGPSFTELAASSERNSWMSSNIVNYVTQIRPELIPVSIRRETSGRHGIDTGGYSEVRSIEAATSALTYSDMDGESGVATGITERREPLNQTLSKSRVTRKLPLSDLRFVANSDSSWFLQSDDGTLYVADVTGLKHPDSYAISTVSTHRVSEDILDVQPGPKWLAIETYDDVRLLSDQLSTSIFDGEVLTIRTFPRSRRYQDMLTITTEKGIYFSGILDESQFRSPD